MTETSYMTEQVIQLKNINDIDKDVYFEFGDLIISSVKEEHMSELAELWANHATIQQIFAPNRYNFRFEGKNWRDFVRRKMDKNQNLLLVATKKGSPEVVGFLYFQSLTIPPSDFIVKGVIEDIYTKPHHRKQSIATNMLKSAMTWAEKHNILSVDVVSMTTTPNISDSIKRLINRSKQNVNLELINI